METGSCSGREVDKFSKYGLTPAPAKHLKTPIIAECIAHIECKLSETLRIGDHTLFVGEVLEAYADSKYFDGELYTTEADLVYQLGGETFVKLGKRVTA